MNLSGLKSGVFRTNFFRGSTGRISSYVFQHPLACGCIIPVSSHCLFLSFPPQRSLPLIRDPCLNIVPTWIIQDNFPNLKSLITPVRSLCRIRQYSQVLRIRTWTSLRGHSSACHLAIWCDSVHKTPLSWVLLQKPLIFQTCAMQLHSGEEFPINNLVFHFPTSVLWPENVSNTHFI